MKFRQALTYSTPMLFDLLSATSCDLIEQDTINKINQSFCDHIFDALYPVIGKRRPKSQRFYNNANNEWFNDECQRSRSDFVTHRNRYSRLKSAENRVNFVRSRTAYNKVKSNAKRALRIKKGLELCRNGKQNPKQYLESN